VSQATQPWLSFRYSVSPLPLEELFWSGRHPAIDGEEDNEEPYPLPFDSPDLGEAALREFLRFELEGIDPAHLKPSTIPLIEYKRVR
jgi:Family of unknown function (DUF6928)